MSVECEALSAAIGEARAVLAPPWPPRPGPEVRGAR